MLTFDQCLPSLAALPSVLTTFSVHTSSPQSEVWVVMELADYGSLHTIVRSHATLQRKLARAQAAVEERESAGGAAAASAHQPSERSCSS